MKISILSDETSWINEYLPRLVSEFTVSGNDVTWVHRVVDIAEGDIAFFLGCGQLVPPDRLKLNRHNLVVHESALPKGRGWSPLTWQILNGADEVPIVLFEASEHVDCGILYLFRTMRFTGTELIDELRKVQAETTIEMCIEFLGRYPDITSQGFEQQGEPTFYTRRRPEDSRLDTELAIKDQFNLLRVVDNARYPAYFELGGEKFIVKVEKVPKKG